MNFFIFLGATIDRIEHFSCGHIVPPENVLPLVIKTGPSNKLLDFSFQKRDLLETLSELSRVLINACNVIPGGVVVFFPSYDYEARYVFTKHSVEITEIYSHSHIFDKNYVKVTV